MKKRILALSLALLTFMSILPISSIRANVDPKKEDVILETSTVDYSKRQSDSVTYDGYEKDTETGTFIFKYTIHEGAEENVVIDLAQCALSLWKYEAQVPGNSYKFQIQITNDSGNIYRYKDDSFVLAPEDTDLFGNFDDGSLLPVLTYDGQYLPISLCGAMIPYYFYKDVFGVSSSGNVTFEMMCQIYDYLEQKGYAGETAITDYMLNFYNNKRNTNYDSLTDFFAEHPDWIDGNLVTNNGIWKMSEAKLLEYIEKYPWIDKFVSAKKSGDQLSVQIKWPEPEVAAVSYNSFYMGLFSVIYGKENADALNPNGDGVAFSRSHGVGDYLPGTELYEETNQYFTDLTADGFKDGDTLEVWSGYGIDGPGMGNCYQNYSFTYYNIIELEQVKPISITPADITIYTGGNGYEGIVDGVDGDTTENHGFPIPGFHLTLPAELNDKLGSIQDLSNLVTFKYDDGKGNTREWKLELYGVPNHSNNNVGYVYKLNSAIEGQDPVRMLLTDDQGNLIVSDDFKASVDDQYKQYHMTIYNGAIEPGYITAEITVNDKTYTYPVEQGTGATLTVRANINETHAPIYVEKEAITSGDFAAVSVENPTYFINENNIQVADITGVRLMVDDLLDQEVLIDYLTNSDEITLPKGNIKFVEKYMDLVDTNNGNAYLTMGVGETTTVYWPVPADYVEGKEAVIYHFSGVDRDYNTGDIIGNIDEVITIVPTLVTINGNRYFEFETSSFSPFVLAYVNDDAQTPADPQKPTDSEGSVDTGAFNDLLLWGMLFISSSLLVVSLNCKRKINE